MSETRSQRLARREAARAAAEAAAHNSNKKKMSQADTAAETKPHADAATKKRFRPVRSSVRTIMARVGEPKAIRRSHTVNLQEDLALQVLAKVAARAGSLVQSNGRAKVTKKDVLAAVKLEFGEGFAGKAVGYAEEALKRVE